MIDRQQFRKLLSQTPGATFTSIANRTGIGANRLGQLLDGVARPRARELESLGAALRVGAKRIAGTNHE